MLPVGWPTGSSSRYAGQSTYTGCGAAWLAHLLWEQGVGSSNLPIPTNLRGMSRSDLILGQACGGMSRIFRSACSQLGADVEDVLMVGDSHLSDGGCIDHGIAAFLLPPALDEGPRRLSSVVDIALGAVS